MLEDVRRLLDQDGLREVPVIATSARQGEGIPELRAEIARRVADKKATRQRIEADLRAVAARLNEECGTGKPRSLAAGRAQAMEEALADSAGVPTVVAAIERSTRMRAGQGHRLAGRLVALAAQARPAAPAAPRSRRRGQAPHRPRAHVDPEATPVQRAQVDSEVRALADDVSAGMTRPWADAVRRASVSRVGEMADRLDAEIAATDLGVARLPVWAGAVRVLQWLLILAALVGGAWTLALAASGSLGDDSVPAYGGIDLPIMLLVGGVGVGILLALLCRVLVDRHGAQTGRRGGPEAPRRRARGLPGAGGEPGRARARRLPDRAQRPGRRARQVGEQSAVTRPPRSPPPRA